MSATPPLRPAPTPEQRLAADPSRSVWVTASAGTGKTRVLADRVLRLLLQGAAPERILCLTFTKAGAAEMLTRIQDDLARFATLRPDPLRRELRTLLGRTPREQDMQTAPTLLPRVLDLAGGLQIMTIHSFCQSLLRRFPLEADVVPHFDVLDPRDDNELMSEALDRILEDPAIDLDHALGLLAVLVGEQGFREGLDALRQNRLRFQRALFRCDGPDGVIRALAARLGVDPDDDLDGLRRAACGHAATSPGLAAACRALREGSDANRRYAGVIASWVDSEVEQRINLLDQYMAVFVTQKGTPRTPLAVKSVEQAAPAAIEALRAEQERLVAFSERCKAVEALQRSRALIEVGAAALREYERLKRGRAALDYDDLIERTVHLLAQPGIAPWIQYKLDQRIDHLLVDEAQDTSPEQWAVIEALSDDFFSGEGAATAERTLFVVGDEKQSIFSFQGADLATYEAVHQRLRERAGTGRRPWSDLPLEESFRSVAAVLEAVDAVFDDPEVAAGLTAGGAAPHHVSGRPPLPGTVELWPLVEVESEPEPAAWELPDRPDPVVRAEHELAKRIAGRIERWLRDGTPAPSTGEAIRPGDVMIVVRNRTLVRDFVIRELKRRAIPVAGADRLRLADEIAVMDLIALGEALLLPEDDLTLASVLKSPLFGIDEERLFRVAHGRDGRRLVTRLRELAGDDPVVGRAWRLFEELRAGADQVPPFEFYARLLGEGGGRRRLLQRLGPAAIEPVEAFLAQALGYERAHPPSLQGFLHWLRRDTTELVRDPDRPRDEVRVLTVHGAKGLEAPIVIIADAALGSSQKDKLLWLEDGLPLWRLGQKDRDPVGEAAAERTARAQQDEERRLLYVAMTRARDWLIVAGWRRKQKQGGTWYDLVAAGLDRVPGVERIDTGDGTTLRLHHSPPQGDLPLAPPARTTPPPPLPPHLERPPPADAARRPSLSPSRLAEAPAPESPLAPDGGFRFRRGRIVHRLLQILPDTRPEERSGALTRLLAERAEGDPRPREETMQIQDEVGALLENPLLADLFGPGSRAEVPVVGTIDGQPFAGQVDRLVIRGDEILVVDYKTDRAPPEDARAAPVAYVRQLAAYRRLLLAAFPEHTVRCGLLWTVLPRLDLLEAPGLDRGLDRPLHP